MQVKKSKITINLCEGEKKIFNNFYDFLDDMTRGLYEAEAEHTEFCTTLVHIMEEIMALYDFWGGTEEELNRVFNNREKMKFVEELNTKYLFTNGTSPITFLLTTNFIDWKEDFLKQSEKFTNIVVTSPLTNEAQEFFSQKLGFDIPYEQGTYAYNTYTEKWSKI